MKVIGRLEEVYQKKQKDLIVIRSLECKPLHF